MTKKGIVKWFSGRKGYGFIEYDETEEIFVHFTGIEMDGFRTLKEGQAVKFDAVEGSRGLQATNVAPFLDDDDDSNEDDDTDN